MFPEALIALDGENGDVVLLAEVLSRTGNIFGGSCAESSGAIEAQEFAGRAAGFKDAVGHERELLVRIEVECGGDVLLMGAEAEREAAADG